LGPDAFTDAWTVGQSKTWQETVADVLATPIDSGSVGDPRSRRNAAHDLTRREREVLRLLAAGYSNREIGEQLYISPTTAASHVAHIFDKLGVDSRAKATDFARRHDLD
jgi:DNA-binding NarL/FixJ family response regulator